MPIDTELIRKGKPPVTSCFYCGYIIVRPPYLLIDGYFQTLFLHLKCGKLWGKELQALSEKDEI